MAETLEDRISKALTACEVSQAEMLRRVGVGKNSLTEWRTTDRKMPAWFVQRFIKECGAAGLPLDGHWLLTGEGDMVRLAESEAVRMLAEIGAVLERGQARPKDNVPHKPAPKLQHHEVEDHVSVSDK